MSGKWKKECEKFQPKLNILLSDNEEVLEWVNTVEEEDLDDQN